jgi:predicted solute-binding protein
MKSRLAVSKALNIKPIIFGLDREESPFELVEDFPANNALKLSKRSENIRNAFLSPMDYARHGAEYCIVPEICVSSSQRTDTILLILKSGLRNIERIAVDVRYTSEIILANIILKEKYRNESSGQKQQYIPMMPDIGAMLAKADAALVVNDIPKTYDPAGAFVIDLVEEWNDMTGLPYIHGFWVGREEEMTGIEAKALADAKKTGIPLLNQVSHAFAQQNKLSLDETARYMASFSYDLGKPEEESLAEYMHYAYYHGVIGDVPDIRFFDLNSVDQSQN